MSLRVPRTLVLATSVFDEFIQSNNLLDKVLDEDDDDKLVEIFMQHSLPNDVTSLLSTFLQRVSCPLAVRSSSLFEDAFEQPFAGVYETYLLANNEAGLYSRLQNLTVHIMKVYASTYSQLAKKYARTCGKRLEEERMAVLIQELVGYNEDGLFHPSFSGVMRSYDFYSVEGQDPRDGMCAIAPGFGGTVVDGGPCLQFSPTMPSNVMMSSSLPAQRLSLSLKRSDRTEHSFGGTSPKVLTTHYKSAKDVSLRTFRGSREQPLASRDKLQSGEVHDIATMLGTDVHGNEWANEDMLDEMMRLGGSSTPLEEQGGQHSSSSMSTISITDVITKSHYRLPQLISLLLQVGSKAMASPVEIEVNKSTYSMSKSQPCLVSILLIDALLLTCSSRSSCLKTRRQLLNLRYYKFVPWSLPSQKKSI